MIAVETDNPNLLGYIRRARLAGRHTAAVFRRDHPDLYARTPQSKFDVSRRPWLRPIALLARLTLPALVAVGQRVIDWSFVPVGLRILVIRTLFAASYMVGTAEGERS